ncbi:hypothetical protein [Oryza sativa Japonica Group]|uniref:Uncharacterized protein OSJNOa013M08.4 n=1 Tax=Oryza sativa subsp. japonica TaxID=39947 RepID=Q5N6V7_ORYSJ|nr:hypothetical protein [Oryza sativa Japonica Group]
MHPVAGQRHRPWCHRPSRRRHGPRVGRHLDRSIAPRPREIPARCVERRPSVAWLSSSRPEPSGGHSPGDTTRARATVDVTVPVPLLHSTAAAFCASPCRAAGSDCHRCAPRSRSVGVAGRAGSGPAPTKHNYTRDKYYTYAFASDAAE